MVTLRKGGSYRFADSTAPHEVYWLAHSTSDRNDSHRQAKLRAAVGSCENGEKKVFSYFFFFPFSFFHFLSFSLSLFRFFSFYLPSPYPLSDSQHFSSFFTFRLRPFSLRQSSARRCWSTSMLVGRLRLPKEEDVLRAVGKKSDSDIRSWWLLTLAFLSISKINLNCYFRTSLKSCLKINNLSLSVSLSSFSVVGGGGIWLDF